MNQGIYYLYEYETGQRKRNLGFLQISHQYRSCMMTLHLKSLPLSPGTALELHGFYNKDRDLIHAPCAILNYSGGSIATRLSISESLFPCGKSFSGLEGFLLLPEGKAEPLFWAASVNALPVGFSLISAEELSRSPEEVSPADRLFLGKGEEAIFTMGMMVRKEWLNKKSDARLILFPGNMDGGLVFQISEEDLL